MSYARFSVPRVLVIVAAVLLAAIGGVAGSGSLLRGGSPARAPHAAARAVRSVAVANRQATPSVRPVRAATTAPSGNVLVRIAHPRAIYAAPSTRSVVGTMPAASPFLRTPVTAWVNKVSADGQWGRVPVPWSGNTRQGWIKLSSLRQSKTPYVVHASISRRQIEVLRDGKVVLREPAGVGRVGSATPPGLYFVTDRVVVPKSEPWYGSFAFGLSGIQTHLPAHWQGAGNQLAIHGTATQSSVGTRSSAGCFRVTESTLQRLKPLLVLGTPVVIER